MRALIAALSFAAGVVVGRPARAAVAAFRIIRGLVICRDQASLISDGRVVELGAG
jgi:hypothetical protein